MSVVYYVDAFVRWRLALQHWQCNAKTLCDIANSDAVEGWVAVKTVRVDR